MLDQRLDQILSICASLIFGLVASCVIALTLHIITEIWRGR